MAHLVRYLTHPQVQVDPALPVPSWGLSDIGHARIAALIEAGWLVGTRLVVSSAETKAVDAAVPIARALNVCLEVHKAMHENDRSATGFLPPRDFEGAADRFFARPDDSVRGWETARHAQARIVRETEVVLSRADAGDVLIVGHGAVGTLLMCHYAKLPISRAYDQPPGGGHYFTLFRQSRAIVHGWRAMEHGP